MNAAAPWMTFLWPSMLWAMLALPVIVGQRKVIQGLGPLIARSGRRPSPPA